MSKIESLLFIKGGGGWKGVSPVSIQHLAFAVNNLFQQHSKVMKTLKHLATAIYIH